MVTATTNSNEQLLLTPPTSTRFHAGVVLQRLNRRIKTNKVVTVTPNENMKDEDSTIMTPRKLLPDMDELQAQNVNLVHAGRYLISLQPEKCRGLADLFLEEEGGGESGGEVDENKAPSFPAKSYQTPPRTSINQKHFLSPPILPSAKKRRILMATPPFNHSLSLPAKLAPDALIQPTILKPRNLNLFFGELVNDKTLA